MHKLLGGVKIKKKEQKKNRSVCFVDMYKAKKAQLGDVHTMYVPNI